ncbi:MAG TPA: hypothetical protein PKO18_08835 [Chitinophagales bacterium]|nr:hypothetical protein [Chitinophagales bacterium]HNL85330.1 hypothetical protein [Chitinophagales bacterium]
MITVKNALEKYYGFNVVLLPETVLPPNAFTPVKSPRYRADSLLLYLQKIKPDSVNYIMGITEADISTTKKDASGKIKNPATKYADWGIMGLAFRPGNAAVISTFRIKSSDKALFAQRLEKIALHELGHNLGLPHCPSKSCFMNDANESISTIDNEKTELCSSCKQHLRGQFAY